MCPVCLFWASGFIEYEGTIYGLDRIKRAGAITLDIKCVCIYKYRAMYNNNIVLQ